MSGFDYEIRVDGSLPDAELAHFHGMVAESEAGATVLRGAVPDQPALLGVIVRVENLGLSVTMIRRLRRGS